MSQSVGIQQSANHLLVPGMMLLRFLLEKFDAFSTQSNRDLYRILLEYKILGRRQEIRHDL